MTEILVEVRPRSSRAAGQLASAPVKPEPLAKRMDELADTLNQLSVKIGDRLTDLTEKNKTSGFSVDEIELKVNLDLESEAVVIIARSKAGFCFEASIKWKRR